MLVMNIKHKILQLLVGALFICSTNIYAKHTLADLLMQLGKLEKPAQQLIFIKKNEALFAQSTNEQLKGQFYLLKVQTYRENGQYELSKALLEKLITRWQQQDSAVLLAKSYYEQGMLLKAQGEYLQSLASYKKALVFFESLDMLVFQSKVLRRTSYSLRSLGKYAEALQLIERAKSIAEKINNRTELAHAYGGLSNIYSDLGLYGEALEFELKSLEYLPMDITSKNDLANSYYAIAEKNLWLENYDDSIKYFSKAYEIDLELNIPNDIGHSQVKLSQAYWHNGEFDTGLKFAKLSLESFSRLKSVRNIAWAKSNIGDVYLAKKQYKKALEYLIPAKLALEKLQENSLLNRVKLSIGQVLFKLKKRAQNIF